MVVEGAVVFGHWDGALAYRIMCPEDGVQVMCVTYYRREASDAVVRFAGDYQRVGEFQVRPDPCLVYDT